MLVNGRSMLERCISNIERTKIFDEIIVSSDDEFTLNEANRLGVTGLLRVPELASDIAGVDQVCLQLIPTLSDIGDFCCIYPTAILLTPETIIDSFIQFSERGSPSLMGASKYNYNPVEAFLISKDNTLDPMLPEWRGRKSQEFPLTCVSNGTLYWSSVEHLMEYSSLISPKTQPFFVPDHEVCDVNTVEDLKILNDLVLKLESKLD
jgi:CMP-N-acetylneuraminic acid synthetase